MAGFTHLALVEVDPHACASLRLNRPRWNVVETDLAKFDATPYKSKLDLLGGGVPCPPFSVAGKQLGAADERDLFPVALRVIEECLPRAVMLENVRGILDPVFAPYRRSVLKQLRDLGYVPGWRLLNASHFGVPQLRPRAVLVAIQKEKAAAFKWPRQAGAAPQTVGEVLLKLMKQRGWKGASEWARQASSIAPTIVGGSKKHGGPDLGPTRARRMWAELGVDGIGIANESPETDFKGMPRLTVEMVACLQGFPPDWQLSGKKTNAYRQVGNAFPPPVAFAVGEKIAACLLSRPKSGDIEKGDLFLDSMNSATQQALLFG